MKCFPAGYRTSSFEMFFLFQKSSVHSLKEITVIIQMLFTGEPHMFCTVTFSFSYNFVFPGIDHCLFWFVCLVF